MVRTLSLVCLLAAAAAQAQVVTLTATTPGAVPGTISFNGNNCSDTLSVTWTSTLTTLPCSSLTTWATQGECGDAPVGGDVLFPDVSGPIVLTSRTSTFVVKYADLPGFKYSDAGAVCGTDHLELDMKICGAISTTGFNLTCTVNRATSLAVIYDSLPPVAPTIDSVLEKDSAVQLNFTASADTTVVHFDARAQSSTDFTELTSIAVTTGNTVTLTGLLNGTTYDLQARAEDSAGNISDPSEPYPATPRHTTGFWTNYRAAGGTDQGCTAIPGLPIALAGGLWWLRRKRK